MWRRVTSYVTPGDEAFYPPRPLACSQNGCCPKMEYRYRVINRTGTANACGLNIADYDSEQEGIFTTLEATLSGRWVFTYPPGGTPIVRRSCTGTRSVSSSGFTVPFPLLQNCEGDEQYDFPCESPSFAECYVGFTNYCGFEEGTPVWTGSGPVSSSDAAAMAYGAAQRTFVGGWSEWIQGTVGGWAGLGATDWRVGTGCSQSNRTLELEFRGRILPTIIRWEDRVTPSAGGSPTYTPRELMITSPEPLSIDWTAAANTTVLAGNLAVWLPG